MGKKLVVISGTDTGREFPLPDAGAFVLGRSKESDTRLADPRVSRKHCQVEVTPAGVVLQEFASTSGTFVNDEKVAQRPLTAGDVIRIGTTELRLQEDDPYEAATLGGAQLQALVAAPPPPAPAPTAPGPAAPAPAAPAVAADDASLAGEPLTSLLGAPLGSYRVEAILARGQSSFIFRATDTRDDRKVALKVMRAKYAAVERDVLLFQATLQLFHGLRHPHLITVFETGKEKAHLWAAQELVEGESLSAAVERVSAGTPRAWPSALRIARDVARGLDFLHKAEVLHRNVTPRCIRLTGKEETAKLGGFRQAARLGNAPFPPRRNEDILREIEYLPPERLRSECKGDERSDIYSLGACLYALLTGRPPFENRGSLPETLNQILQSDPVQSPAFAALPEDVQQLVGRMLAKRSEDRPAMRELIGELDRVLAAAPADQPAPADPPAPPPPPKPAPAMEKTAPPAPARPAPALELPAAEAPVTPVATPLAAVKPTATVKLDDVLPLPVSKPVVPLAPPDARPLGDGTLMQMPPAIVQPPLILQPADEPTYLGEGPPGASTRLEEIGRGEHATVFRDCSKPNQPVAIKQLNEDVRNGLFQTKGFWDEVQFLTDLDHQHVVKIQKLDAERGWIVMDLLPTTLAKKLAEAPLPADFVRKVVEQALLGLKYLHQQNKLHGTIKPANILLSADGTVKLGDCAGLRLEAALQKPRTKMKYVAPEMLDTRFGRIGAGVDLYCLGFVALEMLMGKRIDTQFARVRDAGKNADLGWARQHASRSEKLPSVAELAPDTPPDLVRVLDRMLHKEVSQRYRSAGEALRDLRGGGSAVAEPLPPPAPPARKPAAAEIDLPPAPLPAVPKPAAPPPRPAPAPLPFDPVGSSLAPVATAAPVNRPAASWKETAATPEPVNAKGSSWLANPLLLVPLLGLLSFGAFAAVMWGGLGGLGSGGPPPTAPVVGGPRTPAAALLIGVNEAGKELPPFRHAEADVQELGRVLVAADYKPGSVVVLTQNQGDAQQLPTAANIRQRLQTLTEQRKPGDGLLLALAGPLVQFRGEDECYFCPADARLADKATLIPLSELYQVLQKWNTEASLVLLDGSRGSVPGDGAAPPPSALLTAAPNPQKIPPPKNLTVFFSCGDGKKSFCHLEQRNGAFFHFITRRLQGVGDISLSKRTSIDDLVKFATAEVYAYVTKTYGEVQRPEVVGPDVRPAIVAEVTAPISLYMQGLSNYRQRRYTEANFYCGRSIGEREYVEAYLLQGLSKTEQGKLNEALADFTRALELAPGNADAHAGRAEVYLRRGDGAAALKEAQRAIDLDGGFGPFYATRAQARLLLKDRAAAFSDFEKALALTARSPRMLNARGLAYLKTDQLDEALDDFNAAAQGAPADPEALFNRGLVQAARKQPSQAIGEFSRALELNQDFAPAYFHRARAHDQLASDERDPDAKRQHQLRAAADREKARSLGFVAVLPNE